MNLPDVLNDDPAVRFGAGGMSGNIVHILQRGVDHLIHCCLTKICPTTRGAEALVISSLGFQTLLPFVPIIVSVLLKTRKSLRRNDF